MKGDARKAKQIIIRKNNEYLMGFGNYVRWSIYVFDAWRTKDYTLAREIAKFTGGIMMLFDPINGELKVL